MESIFILAEPGQWLPHWQPDAFAAQAERRKAEQERQRLEEEEAEVEVR